MMRPVLTFFFFFSLFFPFLSTFPTLHSHPQLDRNIDVQETRTYDEPLHGEKMMDRREQKESNEAGTENERIQQKVLW